MKADIKFANDQIFRCIGTVANGKSVPWKDENDVKRHIRFLQDKGYNVTLVRIVE